MKALDLYCGAGGASYGLNMAGFEVVGVDINPQKNYPFGFIQQDAISLMLSLLTDGAVWLSEHPPLLLNDIDLIWASPPCQFGTEMNNDKSKHLNLIPLTRECLKLLQKAKPSLMWAIENVEGAREHLADPVMLCGSMFDLGTWATIGRASETEPNYSLCGPDIKEWFQLQRHRYFETNFPVSAPRPCAHTQPVIGLYGGHVRCRSSQYWRGGADFPGQDKRLLAVTAMGLHGMTMAEMSEAIPPAYALHIGNAARERLNSTRIDVV